MRVWSYVITNDGGAAPNYDRPNVTLTICKPRIRRSAKEGELIIGFTGKRLSPRPHAVCWAGIVGEVLSLADYWSDERFGGKRPFGSSTPDNIYQPYGEELRQVPNPVHDERHIATDVRGCNALVFARAWHLGGCEVLPEHFGLWVDGNRRLEPLREIDDELWCELEAWLDTHAGPLPSVGNPSSCKSHQRRSIRPSPQRLSC